MTIQGVMSDVRFSYQVYDPTAAFLYNGGGSTAGKNQIAAGTVDFASTEAPFEASYYSKAPDLILLPFMAISIVPVFNIPNVQSLTMSRSTLAGIYSGEINYWNDARVAADNPHLVNNSLPAVILFFTGIVYISSCRNMKAT